MSEWQSPERIWVCRGCGEVDVCECPYNRQSYAPTDLLEAAEKRIKELEREANDAKRAAVGFEGMYNNACADTDALDGAPK